MLRAPSSSSNLTKLISASKYRNLEDQIWRSGAASVRSYAEGYDGFETNRPAHSIPGQRKCCATSYVDVPHTSSPVVSSTSDSHFATLLAAIAN